jgi:hypothetical protein
MRFIPGYMTVEMSEYALLHQKCDITAISKLHAHILFSALLPTGLPNHALCD